MSSKYTGIKINLELLFNESEMKIINEKYIKFISRHPEFKEWDIEKYLNFILEIGVNRTILERVSTYDEFQL